MTLVQRYLGGESGHRSFFGGVVPKARIVGMVAGVVLFIVLTPFAGIWGVATGFVVIVGTVIATLKTHRGSFMERREARVRWVERVASGQDTFVPFDDAQWQELQEAYASARKRKARASVARTIAAMRANPDGADGMGWLQMAPGSPGIAWHAPTGEAPYLSVAFEVSGQLRGLESNTVVNIGAKEWGRLLAACGKPSSLARDVQPLTRVVPSDSTLLEHWAQQGVDENAPLAAATSYREAIALTGDGSTNQRHFVVVRWPITATFKATALRYGEGREGWRALMVHEIRSFRKQLARAKVGHVDVLSARRVSAVILHMQNPSRPLDYIRDVDPARFGVPSHDEYSAHIVTSTDPFTGEEVTWWHRTAAIRADHMDIGTRTPLWLLKALKGEELRAIRTFAFHVKVISKREAAQVAKKDVTRDSSEALADSDAGRLGDGETSMNLTAARRRLADLKPGSSHQGVEWVGFVTVSARTRDELVRSCRQLSDACAAEMGIDQLNWLDSYQSAASGTTWPIGRGQGEVKASAGEKLMDRLAGRVQKEVIS